MHESWFLHVTICADANSILGVGAGSGASALPGIQCGTLYGGINANSGGYSFNGAIFGFSSQGTALY